MPETAADIVDTHVHIVSPDTARYPLTGGTRDGNDYWSDGSCSVAEVLRVQAVSGVHRTVLVQGVGAYGYDCRYLLDAVAEHPERTAAVVAVDMAAPAAAARALRDLAREPGVTGVRLFAVSGGPDATGPRWLTDPASEAVWDVSAEVGLTVVLTAFAHQLPLLRPSIRSRPSLRVALDHCGFPDARARTAGRAPVRELADLPGVHVKVTTHLLASAQAAGEDPADVIDDLASAFGDERLTWGSDFPQTREPTYPGMLSLAGHAIRRRTQAQRDSILAGTAHRLWFAETASDSSRVVHRP
ncbi:amidohydrolase family protein [Yinghuangia soli]|uniref:amidohydrolase family protein n=1 Tax=Yinghuangia soli TaxID=2908204 RepID=UPI001F31C3A0|nr:amidohydrolase family protein [Yinghuangia soli]